MRASAGARLKIPEMLAVCDAEGLKMFNVYVGVEIGPTNRVAPEAGPFLGPLR